MPVFKASERSLPPKANSVKRIAWQLNSQHINNVADELHIVLLYDCRDISQIPSDFSNFYTIFFDEEGLRDNFALT